MGFRENYPSLKGKIKNLGCAQGHLNCCGGEDRDYVIVPYIIKYTRDNKRILEALNKHQNGDNMGEHGFMDRYKQNVLKELNLID